MKILIVGAGPAGLATAIFLDPKKHDITVIEREKEFTTMGYGIFFFNEGKKILRKTMHGHGIHQLLKQIGFKKYVDEAGETLSNIHYNQLFHVNSYDAITSMKREDLHRLLREHLQKNIQIKMGTTIQCIDNRAKNAVVKLSDGSFDTFDLVVGAEGSHSQLRDLFFSYRIKKLPWIARYFWIDKPMTRFMIEWSRDATVMFMPHKEKTTVLSIENNEAFAACDEHEIAPAALLKFYESIGISKSAMKRNYIKSHVSPMRYVYTDGWFKNRIVLIGDAQHAMTPTLGFGTSLALDDAYHLANAINSISETHMYGSVIAEFAKRRTRKIRILRSINRLEDFLVFRQSKRYFNFWYAHRSLMTKISQMTDRLIRLGWRYS